MNEQSLPLSEYVLFYLNLSKNQRKIFQFLRWYQKRYPRSFPKMETISKYSRISVRAIQKFFSNLEKTGMKRRYLKIVPRFRQTGGNSSNEYILNKNLNMAMEWLEIHHKLNSPRNKRLQIFLSMQKSEKVHPVIPKKFTPLSKDRLLSKDFKETSKERTFLNPLLGKIRISEDMKTYASAVASDREIHETLEACLYREKNGKILNRTGYFFGTLRNIVKKYRGLKI